MSIINTKTKTNSKRDIVTVPVGYESYKEMVITIPRKAMGNLSDDYTAFYGAKIALPILSIAGYCVAISHDSGLFIGLSLLAFMLSLVFILAVKTPAIIAGLGGEKIKVEPKYFSNWCFAKFDHLTTWGDEHQKEFLEILENDFVRDDFIQLLKAAENQDISPEKAKKTYKYMKEVGMTDKKIIEKSMDNMLDKYKSHVEIIREIETA